MPADLPLAFPSHPAPEAGFRLPLEMLAACHRRVESQCATLSRLAAHVATVGADEAARQAAQAVLRYFDTAARDHHADEEQDLFPALLEAMAGSDAVCIGELTAGLCAEHRVLERYWQALRERLSRIAAGEHAALPAALVQDFANGYRRHVAREEAELLPLAQRLLDADGVERLGDAMLQRRGISPPP